MKLHEKLEYTSKISSNARTMQELHWNVGGQSIPYLLGYQCQEEIVSYLTQLGADLLLILADKALEETYGADLVACLPQETSAHLLTVHSREETKTFETLGHLISQAILAGATRHSVVVTLGGGLVGNMGGMLAALLFRGIRLVHIPTTLLAMHDSVTSIKQAVNSNQVKNIIGTYYAPSAILADIAVLHSLPEKQLSSGVFELVKNGFLLGGKYYTRLQECLICWQSRQVSLWHDLIVMGVEAKASLLRDDPKENKRAILFEYGHTIGHALELSCSGGLSHGEAIAWGMACAIHIAKEMGYMSQDVFVQHMAFLRSLQLPPLHQHKPSLENVLDKILHDNKRGYIQSIAEYVPMILLHDFGQVVGEPATHYLTYVSLALIRQVILALDLVTL